MIEDHAKWLIEHKGETVGCNEIRKHLLAYVKHIPGARQYRSQLTHVKTFDAIQTILDEIFSLDI